MDKQIRHPQLGHIRGLAGNGVIQFLGIKYASLSDCFAEPQLIVDHGSQAIDATKIGPQATFPPSSCDDEFSLIQHSLPHGDFDFSVRNGLHLNITVPSGEGTALPVFVFIHGGGFMTGSNAWPQYDQSGLVRVSSANGTPCIAVAINYRVGVPGFLTSAELRAAGYKSNNGLRDQKAALQWIQLFIAGFGGDPGRVTLAGQSAGAVSAMLHLATSPPLFSQVLLMSGSTFVVPPISYSVAEMTYRSVVLALGFNDLATEQRIDALRSADASKLFGITSPGLPLLPVVDQDIVFQPLQFSSVSDGGIDKSLQHVRLMIGNCQLDGSIFEYALNPAQDNRTKFLEALANRFSKTSVAFAAVQDAYQITPDSSIDTVHKSILRILTDVGFYAPAVTLARNWPGPSFLYHFNEPNPWSGRWQGEATHVLDVAYLFQNFNAHLSGEQRALAQDWAAAVIKFVQGANPFPPCQEHPRGAMLFGPSSAVGVGPMFTKDDTHVRSTNLETVCRSVRLDDLQGLMLSVLSGD